MSPIFWSFQSDIWRTNSPNPYEIFSWNFQDYRILNIVTAWQIFVKFWHGSCPSLKSLHHLVWNDQGAIQITCFWIAKTLSACTSSITVLRKITYNLLLIGFFHKQISMQSRDVGHMLHSHTAHQLPSICMHQSVISSANGNDSKLNRQFSFGIHLNQWSKSNLLM